MPIHADLRPLYGCVQVVGDIMMPNINLTFLTTDVWMMHDPSPYFIWDFRAGTWRSDRYLRDFIDDYILITVAVFPGYLRFDDLETYLLHPSEFVADPRGPLILPAHSYTLPGELSTDTFDAVAGAPTIISSTSVTHGVVLAHAVSGTAGQGPYVSIPNVGSSSAFAPTTPQIN